MNSQNKKQNKEKLKIILWAVFCMLIGIMVVLIFSFGFQNINLKKIFHPEENVTNILQSFIDAQAGLPKAPAPVALEQPKYFYFSKALNNKLKISAQAFLVGDLNTGEIIMSRNPDQKLPIASVSKLMTALVTSDITKSGDITTVTKNAVATEGQNGGLYAGEKIKTTDLLYPLLLESSNDAAEAIAQHFGRDTFLQKMNQVAASLKMAQTSYSDPSGLTSKNQSTVTDLFKLTGYINQQKPDLIKITNMRSFVNKKHSWSNISQFLEQDGYIGGKSGYTNPAQETVISMFSAPLLQSNVRPVAIVLLHSVDRYKDVQSILKYLKSNIFYGGEADAKYAWVKLQNGLPEITDPDFVTMTFGGDIMLDRGVKNSVLKNFNGDYSALFSKLGILKKSDIVFANLEGTASDQGKDGGSLYSFRMDPAVIPALKGAGISVLSLANNHVGDWGLNAYLDTLGRLKENEITYTGGGNNYEEAKQPAIIEKYGMKIGFLAFSDKGPNFMRARADQGGVLLASDPNFDDIVKNAASQVDYLVVAFHFGEEYQTKHNARQEFLARQAVDDGAKIVIGAHPHVIEDTEVYKNSYIAYSLGNFIFDQKFSANTMQGMLLQIKLNRDGSMSVQKNISKLNSAFQPDKLILGKEEKVKFAAPATTISQ
ncbi:MAG: CapA family protein [Candidatus Paceibacterota bacterium]